MTTVPAMTNADAPLVVLPPKPLTPEAERALAEAAARRAAAAAADAARPAGAREFGGQSGPDPVRYGDWEKGGIVSDF